ncbi:MULTISPECIES: SgcJ/EcaC family oxidoreductase [Streptomyces]|uniref:SgcJ/EcaC family oxidoreductase n=2 Tax=Streptomyces TaxID=1883 RepID=A0A646KR18_STRJU|nr:MULTISPECIES: SgcJ/EcaC family oxidoreductase [Streptomyces]MQS34784.1 SgcJ/EcaC family oxidoreductase [Streptomyces katsurahamanus]MQT04675.1 SgcJ/EcaC family oxidoreductase [Streptomyces jumonjinensis]
MTAAPSTTDTGATVSDADRAAAVAVPGRIVAAWADHDAAAFARNFTPEGSMILPGFYRDGRQQIEEFMAAAFQGPFKGTRVTGTPLALKFLRPDVALVITQGGILAPGETEVADERAIRATWVISKENGEWLLAAYQNSPRDSA